VPRASKLASDELTPRDGQPVRPSALSRWDERRNEVVDTAAHVFAARGYHATTIDDLVEATGLKRGGLYHYIRSKKELLIRIHERFINPLLDDARQIVAAGDPPDVTLRNLAKALMRDIAEYHDQVTVFLHEWRIIENEPEWHEVLAARKEFEGLIAEVLERGVREGVFVLADVRITVLGFLGMINYSYQWFSPNRSQSAEGLANQFVEIFLYGIETSAARRKPSS
jgi:TetR/AcrR family transcriptional regulator, cholesterol catabolism regulator